MPFNSHTASLAGKKSKRGKSKFTSSIKDKMDLVVTENLDYLLGHMDELSNSERIKILQVLLSYVKPKFENRPHLSDKDEDDPNSPFSASGFFN